MKCLPIHMHPCLEQNSAGCDKHEYIQYIYVWCRGVVAEKSDNELFFVDKNAVTCTAVSSEGECTERCYEILFILLFIIVTFNAFNADVDKVGLCLFDCQCHNVSMNN